MGKDNQRTEIRNEEISYIETPNEAVARHLDKAINEICSALSLRCMENETELRMELFHIGEALCQQRIAIGGIPKRDGIGFGKLPAK
ncbi:MAG: hypothetical protein IKK34_10775 [Clostridia bacterium]|nr:hypothetical protein [Clostridia bacterium]